jgi:hypothetical protein
LAEVDEQTTNKLAEMLISVLHGQQSDSRELAVVQLVLMGKKAVPPLMAYLEKEEALEQDIEALGKPPRPLAATQKDHELYRKATEAFESKWGNSPSHYKSENVAMSREVAIEGALKALTLLGQNNFYDLFPHLAQK